MQDPRFLTKFSRVIGRCYFSKGRAGGTVKISVIRQMQTVGERMFFHFIQ